MHRRRVRGLRAAAFWIWITGPVALPAGADFPATPIVDDFERADGDLADGPSWADAWTFFDQNPQDRSLEIDAGTLRPKHAALGRSGAAAWLPLYADDVEAHVTWAGLPTPVPLGSSGIEIQVRTLELPDGHTHYYSCDMRERDALPARVATISQRGEGDQTEVGGVNLTDSFEVGDVVGARILGDQLQCWRRHATTGGGFVAGEEELMLASTMPDDLRAGYIVVRASDDESIRLDEFGAGVYPPEVEPLGYPAVPLRDGFSRPDQPLADSPNWAEAWAFCCGAPGDRSHDIENGEILSRNGGTDLIDDESGASAWLPLVAADVEAYVTWTALPSVPTGGQRGSEIQVRTQALPDGHLDHYSCEMLVRDGAPDGLNILWQQGEEAQTIVATRNLQDRFSAGDRVGVRIVGQQLECWRRHASDGVDFAEGALERMIVVTMPGDLGPGYVVLRTTDRPEIRWDDFGAGVYPPPGVPALGRPLLFLAGAVLLLAGALRAARP